MKLEHIIPSAPEVLREAVIVIVGAIIAVAVVRLLPEKMQDFFRIQVMPPKGDTK